MTMVFEDRLSDSPYIEMISHGRTIGEGTTIRPAETNWHMVLTKYNGKIYPILVGPLAMSGVVSWGEGAEIIWIKFKLGTFMPHIPNKNLRDRELVLPEAASRSFWLKGSAWQFPNHENVDTFVEKLVRNDILVSDPVVGAALQDDVLETPSRTVRHRFLHVTGLTKTHIRQVERAQRANALLRSGATILDTVFEAGYFDQPHLTRSLKQFIGYTPAQIVRMSQPACHSVQDGHPVMDYDDTSVLAHIT